MRGQIIFLRKATSLVVAVSLLGIPGIPGLGVSTACAGDGVPADDLQAARSAYETARFDEAISILEPYLDTAAMEGTEGIKPLEILALSHVKVGDDRRAKEMYTRILDRELDWKPDDDRFGSQALKLFDEAKEEYVRRPPKPNGNPPEGGGIPILWPILATAASATTGALALMKKSDADDYYDQFLASTSPAERSELQKLVEDADKQSNAYAIAAGVTGGIALFLWVYPHVRGSRDPVSSHMILKDGVPLLVLRAAF